MQRRRLTRALALALLTVGVGAAGASADGIVYSWSGQVRPLGENPWGLVTTGVPFWIRIFVPPDGADVDGSQNPGFAEFEPASVILDIANESAVVTNADVVFSDDAFGIFDSITLQAQASLFGTALPLIADVRVPPSTFVLADPAAPDLAPVFADTAPTQFGSASTASLSTNPVDGTVTGRLEICGAAPLQVVWNTPTSGTVDGIDVTMAGLASPSLDYDVELQGADFAAAPLCSTAPRIQYDTGSDWSASFSEPVDALLVYARSWRGTQAGVDPVTYQFDAPFTILSGLGEASVENGGTLLSLPETGFHSGILRFEGPIASLAADANTTSASAQALMLAVVPAPEPRAGYATSAIAVLLALAHRRCPLRRAGSPA